MFAPLMDRMTTRDISRRFTASQALEFLESFASELTLEQLEFPAPPWNHGHPYDKYDRWAGLPDTFIRIGIISGAETDNSDQTSSPNL
ncbi:hypothetical protein JB92DRAFT_3227442 [Gautieria morchelliformis]|nr:hypothetical protein JB92DRAFT_3227442 [Gautieria morchelliformis]